MKALSLLILVSLLIALGLGFYFLGAFVPPIPSCTPTNNGTEICGNGVDEDCNGSDLPCPAICQGSQTRPCYTGPPGTQGIGLCHAGAQTCSNSQWGPCTGEATPQAEFCDNVDNDCDGFTDENIICQDTLLFQSGQTEVVLGNIENNVYLKKAGNQIGVVQFDQTPLWTLNVTDNQHDIMLQPSDFQNFNYAIDTEQKKATLTWSGQSLIPGTITVTVIISLGEQLQNHDGAGFLIRIDNNGTYAVFSADFPRIAVRPLGDPAKDILYRSFLTGELEFMPTNLPEIVAENPGFRSTMQFMALYNRENKRQLYLQTTDSTGYRKDFQIEGQGTSTLLSLRNYPENNIVPGNDYVMPYSMELAVSSGNWYDAAQRYRLWALHQPWSSKGPIETRQDFSSVLKNAKGLVTLSPTDEQFNNFDIFVQEGNRIKSYLGAGANRIIYRWYRWHNNAFDRNLPDHLPPRSTVIPSVVNAHAGGQFVIPYINVGPWAYQSASYYANNVEPYAIRNRDGTILLVGVAGNNSQFHTGLDFATPQAQALMISLVRNISNSAAWNGIYWDLWSGFPAVMDYSPSHGHPLGGGNYWTQNKRQIGNNVLALLKQQNSDNIFSGESIDETLIDTMELMFKLYQFNTYSPSEYKIMIPAWETVYHEYIILSGGEVSPPLTEENVDFYQDIINYYIHSGSLPQISNWFADTQTLLHQSPTPPEQEYFDFIKRVVNDQSLQKYLRFGQRLRPPPFSYESLLEQQIIPEPILPPLLNSVWKASDGDIGILYTNVADVVASDLPLEIRYQDYGLAGTYDFFENTQGVRTLLRSGITGDFSYSVTLQPESVRLLEIVRSASP